MEGQKFDRYIIQKELGRGGFATVYLAQDPKLDRQVALKILHPHLAAGDPEFVRLFRQEVKIIARLEHPHIIPIYDFGEFEGRFYLTIKYMQGGSLAQWLKENGPLSWVRTLEIISQIADGLDMTHKQGVLHRDIKPNNILLDEKGEAGLADLGMVQMLSQTAPSTLTGGLIGTPFYMAPEAWNGEQASSATDIYALACCVVEMLTRKKLFFAHSPSGTPWAVKMSHFQPPQFPSQWPADVPQEIEPILRQALHQNPIERPPTVAKFARMLREATRTVNNKPTSTPSIGTSFIQKYFGFAYLFAKKLWGEPLPIATHNQTSTSPLYETKLLLVGDGEVGKTSLVQRLKYNKFSKTSKTPGIDIQPWYLPVEEHLVQLNLWDFGGQGVYQNTHRIFFTQRSLYLVVISGRQENSLEKWLKLIHTITSEAVVIVVVNKVDEHRPNLDERGLKIKYPMIYGFAYTSCKTEEGLDSLQSIIRQALKNIRYTYTKIPSDWAVTKELLQKQNKPLLNYDDFTQICVQQGITEESEQKSLIYFLHDLGAVLYFPENPRLADKGVLNPNWVSEAAYTILNKSFKKGLLKLEDLGKILYPQQYPKEKHLFLMDLLQHFEFCFPVKDGQQYLILDLLSPEQPQQINWPAEHYLPFELHYEPLLPSNVITKLMVQVYQKIDTKRLWRNGFVMLYEENEVFVRADEVDQKIFIAIIGREANRREALTIIRERLQEIHQNFGALKVSEMVVYENLYLPYEHLKICEEEGRSHYIPELRKEVNPTEILNGVEPLLPQSELRDLLVKKFNLQELKDLLMDMDINLAHVGSDGHASSQMASELVKYCQRRGRLRELQRQIRLKRPKL